MDSKKKIIRIIAVVAVVIFGVIGLYVGSIFMSGQGADNKNKDELSQEVINSDASDEISLKDKVIRPISPNSQINALRLKGEDVPTDLLVSEYINRKVLAFEIDKIDDTLYFVDADDYKVYKRGNADKVEEPKELGQLPSKDYDDIKFISTELNDSVILVLKKGGKYEFFDLSTGELKNLIEDGTLMKISNGKIYFLKDGGTKDSEIWYVTSSGEYPKMVLKKSNIRFFEVNSGAILYDDGRKLFRYDLMEKEDYVVFESVISPRYSISPAKDFALIQDKGITFVYRFEKNQDTALSELAFAMDPTAVFWSLDGKQIYNLKDTVLYRYDVEKKESNSWKLIGVGDLSEGKNLAMKYATQQMTSKQGILYISYGKPGSLLMIRVLDSLDGDI